MNQKEAFDIAKTFLDSEATAFDNANIQLEGEKYSVTVSFNYLMPKDVSVLAQIMQDYPQYGYQVAEREISIFTPEGE